MEKYDIYNDISTRTNGDIYIGVVGPVRTGKSTFISKFMEKIVIPNINNKLQKQIATDEIPQSADGSMVMTTQPKFIPANAVKVTFKNKVSAKIRMVDCVGYVVDGATGITNNEKPRLVKTPWSDKEIPFETAAEIGTEKVVNEYSTISIVVTCDGSFTDIKRENYLPAETKVINQLKNAKKPFVIVLNCKDPNSESSINLARELEEKYQIPVISTNVLDLSVETINVILEKILLEFPMYNYNVSIPGWMRALPSNNHIISNLIERVKQASFDVSKMGELSNITDNLCENEYFNDVDVKEIKLGEGICDFSLTCKDGVFYKVLSSECNEEITDDYKLMSYIKSFSDEKRKYEKVKDALQSAEDNGYGVVLPSLSEMILEEPILEKHGGKYGVKIKARAPSLHIVKVDVASEVNPYIGSEKQGEDFLNYLLEKFEDGKDSVLETNFFGKTLHQLISEGMSNKIVAVPKEVQSKMRKTLTRIVNENKGGLICILL